ncbi:MAG: hypothetical protein ABI723_04490 [Bacteroidia bacterium]
MKKIISIALLFGIIFQVFSNAFIIAGFEINQKYIAEKLCVNKDKPMMHCNGHCQLKKHLNEEDKNQTSAPANPKETFESCFCNELKQFRFFDSPLLSIVTTFYNSALPSQTVQPVFHPPGC